MVDIINIAIIQAYAPITDTEEERLMNFMIKFYLKLTAHAITICS